MSNHAPVIASRDPAVVMSVSESACYPHRIRYPPRRLSSSSCDEAPFAPRLQIRVLKRNQNAHKRCTLKL
eukprot:2045335-Pyramimonas_sp.AAC.1